MSLPSIASRNVQAASRIPTGAQASPNSGVSKYRNEIIIHSSNNTADKSMAKLHNQPHVPSRRNDAYQSGLTDL